MKQRILILAPHTDDGELGCGGTIAKFLREGREVFYVAFSTCEESVPYGLPKDILRRELLMATSALGIAGNNIRILDFHVRHFPENRQPILDIMIQLNKEIQPDLVFIPSPHDVHQDHSTVAQEAMRAYKYCSILGYELPWNNYTFNNQTFSKLTLEDVNKKIAALSCYKSQQDRAYFQNDYLVGMCRAHGIQIGCEFSEVFETVRWVF